MRITGRQLRQIIKEEVARMMNEDETEDLFGDIEIPQSGVDELKREIQDLKMNIMVDSGVPNQFSTPNGSGTLRIKVAPPSLELKPMKPAGDGKFIAPAAAQPVVTFSMKDTGGATISAPSQDLINGVIKHVRKMVAKNSAKLSGQTIDVQIPFSWEPGRVVLGSAKVTDGVGFPHYDAGMLTGGVVLTRFDRR